MTTGSKLVIVESPAKAKKIGGYLGDGYTVLASVGHIRDLAQPSQVPADEKAKFGKFGVDVNDGFKPYYIVGPEKKKTVSELRSALRNASELYLATDEDREGEAIAWHLVQTLKPKVPVKRMVFHEITPEAIRASLEHTREVDNNMVDAQETRRVLDRLVGFKLSPVLWRKVRGGLSAGRVQSVAVRLIVEREREIAAFKSEASWRVAGTFDVPVDGGTAQLRAELGTRFKTKDEARAFLETCRGARFSIASITTRPTRRTPAPPFTTSTLQQEAARKLGFPVALTMRVAQQLYESGLITYMRTDSMNLSELCLRSCGPVIAEAMGQRYHHTRRYHTHAKGAQEAHEAIRPTDMRRAAIDGTAQEKRLYDMIWKRTIACQMADAELEKTTAVIDVSGSGEQFTATGEVVKFDGFLRVYRESHDTDNENEAEGRLLPPMTEGMELTPAEICAQQRYTQHPPRYTEASLVHKMEELGIGRPSTYAPTISTIQQREYVVKGEKEGETRPVDVLTLAAGTISDETHTETTGAEKNKLIPTDVGLVVNDFLLEYFPEIMDYNFTANVEKDFDAVAEGKKDWTALIHTFYDHFEPQVEKTLAEKTDHKVGERELGTDPKTGQPVSVKIGRYGPMVQLGTAESDVKPRFATLKPEQSIETITLDEALELFKLPRTLDDYEGKPVIIGTGKFGPYVRHDGKFISLPKGADPMTFSYDEAVELILAKRAAEAQKHIKRFDEEPELEILNGRYGPYITYKGNNYRLPKTLKVEPKDLELADCLAIIKEQDEKPASTKGRRFAKRK